MISTPSTHLAPQPLRSPRRVMAESLELDHLYHIHSIPMARWAPDGKHIYFEINITGRYNIWRVPARGGWPVQVTVSDEHTALLEPSPDGRWLLYAQDQGGNEKPNIFLLPATGGAPINLTRTEGVGYRGLQWSPDGRHIAFSADRESRGDYGVYLLDIESREIRRIADNKGGDCLMLRWSPDGRALALMRTTDYMHSGLSLLDVATRDERTLIPLDSETSSRAVGWTRDGQRLLVVTDRPEDGNQAVGLLSLGTGRIAWCTKDTWETSAYDVSPVDDRFVFARNEAGSQQVFVRHVDGDEERVPLPPGSAYWAHFSKQGHAVLFLHSSPASPAEIWVYHLGRRTLRKVSNSLVGGLDSRCFVAPQYVVYPSFDGTPIAAWVYMPCNLARRKSSPAIVYVHGGPTGQHNNRWYPDIQYLVSRGFVVIAPNFRGSTGFGRAFREANKKDLGGGDLFDAMGAADFLVQSGYVDPRRIGIMGASYGGYLTLMALTKAPKLWSAGVAIVPFANWFTEYEREDPFLQAYDRSLMGDPVKDEALWRDRSPIFFVDRIRAPLLVLAGGNDIRCPAEETRQFVEAIQKVGGTVEAKIYEDEGHWFSRRENQVDAARRVDTFLLKHLADGILR